MKSADVVEPEKLPGIVEFHNEASKEALPQNSIHLMFGYFLDLIQNRGGDALRTVTRCSDLKVNSLAPISIHSLVKPCCADSLKLQAVGQTRVHGVHFCPCIQNEPEGACS